MAKVVTNNTLIDGTRRVRVLLTGQFDGTDGQEAQVIKVNTWGLAGALSLAANGTQLLAGNGNPRPSYNVSIDKVEWTFSGGGYANLAWQGSTNTTFMVLSGQGDWPSSRGTDLGIFSAAPGHTGNIVLSTTNMFTNSSYTIILDLKKDPKSFDQGQIARPKDFNIIVATGNNA